MHSFPQLGAAAGAGGSRAAAAAGMAAPRRWLEKLACSRLALYLYLYICMCIYLHMYMYSYMHIVMSIYCMYIHLYIILFFSKTRIKSWTGRHSLLSHQPLAWALAVESEGLPHAVPLPILLGRGAFLIKVAPLVGSYV